MKMPPCDWAEDDPYAAEKRALSNLFHRMHNPNFRPPTAPGLTDSETFVLLHIGMAAGGGADIRPSQLARHARMTPSALSQTLKRLEEKGCIVRTRAEGDSRSVSIDVTEKGSELIEQARRLRNDAYSAVLDYLGQRDVAELTRILNRIADFAEQMRKAKRAAGTGEPMGHQEDTKPLCGDWVANAAQSEKPWQEGRAEETEIEIEIPAQPAQQSEQQPARQPAPQASHPAQSVQPTRQPAQQPAQSAHQPMSQPAHQPAPQSARRPASQPAQPVQKPAPQPLQPSQPAQERR